MYHSSTSSGSSPASSAKLPSDHQPLDVVRVGVVAASARPPGAGSSSASRRSSRTTGSRRVASSALRRVIRHVQPVDAAHELPPAEDLPDEALDRVQRRAAGAPGALGGLADCAAGRAARNSARSRRARGTAPARPSASRPASRRTGQAGGDEIRERRARPRPPSPAARSRPACRNGREARLDQRHDLPRGRIGREARHGAGGTMPGRQALAVLGVVVPAAACRRPSRPSAGRGARRISR